MENKRLYRSSTNYMICGVCGGIGEYFNIDPTLVRLAWVIFSFMGGSGILAYIIASIIILYGKREKGKPGGYRKDEPGRADEI